MRRFSFFRHMRGGGAVIRAAQMADRLRGRINPSSGYEDDVCVYILGIYSDGPGPEVENAYYDVMDCGMARLERIRRRTKGDVIAVSVVQRDELAKFFAGRRVLLIPQHHCNYENERRPHRPVLNVGCCGGDAAVQWPHDAMQRWLWRLGLTWQFRNELMKRERVIDFYRTLDVQIVFRPTCNRYANLNHMNCLKLANAGSFGIPTVAYPEPAFVAEWSDSFLPASNMTEVMSQVERLRNDPGLYIEMSARAYAKAEQYHIDKIAALYQELAA